MTCHPTTAIVLPNAKSFIDARVVRLSRPHGPLVGPSTGNTYPSPSVPRVRSVWDPGPSTGPGGTPVRPLWTLGTRRSSPPGGTGRNPFTGTRHDSWVHWDARGPSHEATDRIHRFHRPDDPRDAPGSGNPTSPTPCRDTLPPRPTWVRRTPSHRKTFESFSTSHRASVTPVLYRCITLPLRVHVPGLSNTNPTSPSRSQRSVYPLRSRPDAHCDTGPEGGTRSGTRPVCDWPRPRPRPASTTPRVTGPVEASQSPDSTKIVVEGSVCCGQR